MTDQTLPPAVASPCPHCGADPLDHAIEPHQHALTVGGLRMPDHPGSHVIECPSCNAGMIDESREKVLAAWNRRKPVIAPEVARLEQWLRAMAAGDDLPGADAPTLVAWADALTHLSAGAAAQGEAVAWCQLTPNGKIAYFDGKPMIMPGPVGNEHHTTRLVPAPPASASAPRAQEAPELRPWTAAEKAKAREWLEELRARAQREWGEDDFVSGLLIGGEIGRHYSTQDGGEDGEPVARVESRGWKLVPVEPTSEMLLAYGQCPIPEGQAWLDESCRASWAAMLSAVPDAPPAEVDQAAPRRGTTPGLKRHAMEAADELAKYAAAPFFPHTDKRGIVRATSAEWWDGLAELIERAQPLIARALRELTAPYAELASEAAPVDASKSDMRDALRQAIYAALAQRPESAGEGAEVPVTPEDAC